MLIIALIYVPQNLATYNETLLDQIIVVNKYEVLDAIENR